MREIISQFGGMMIAVSVLAVMILFVGKNHLTNGIGQLYPSHRQVQQDNVAFSKYERQTGIHIGYLVDYPIVAGVRTEVKDHFEAKDSTGSPVQLQLTMVQNQNGQSFLFQQENDGAVICLEEPGIYDFSFSGTDQNGIIQNCTVTIPVQTPVPGGLT